MREPFESKYIQKKVAVAFFLNILDFHEVGAIICLGLDINTDPDGEVIQANIWVGHEYRYDVHVGHDFDVGRRTWIKAHTLKLADGGMVGNDAVERNIHLIPICPGRLSNGAVVYKQTLAPRRHERQNQ